MNERKHLANALRILSIDAVQTANSGHPGMPMGMADIAEVLWNDFIHHSPTNPNFWGRDRFVLSNGHGSMLLYSLLHLTGYDLSINDIKNFRQLHSKTPGHPEFAITPGVEATTGPLGQGIANAVGMSIAAKTLAKTFNKDDISLFNQTIYCFVGDGCLMEGISHEVCSLAGTLELGNLIVFWDDNGISIDGNVKYWFNENTPLRFKAYNWNVIENIDGHDPQQIKDAICKAKSNTNAPTLICCKTTIGYGSDKFAGTSKVHGSPLGSEEILKVRSNLGWDHPPFEIPEEIYRKFDARDKGKRLEEEFNQKFEEYKSKYPDDANELLRRMNCEIPDNITKIVDKYFSAEDQAYFLKDQLACESLDLASRQSSSQIVSRLAKDLPELFGGSADLSCSNLTTHASSISYNTIVTQKLDRLPNYLEYGVREFGMSGIMNGMALFGGFIPYGGTFLTFADYAKNAIRLSALMKVKVIYVLTHDSIGLGEDGPTHQPVEQLVMLRATPNLNVYRPASVMECLVSWIDAISHGGPSCIVLSRQKINDFPIPCDQRLNVTNGAYIASSEASATTLDLVIIATGSEVSLALEVKSYLDSYAPKINIRVVSVLCLDKFLLASTEYQTSIISYDVPRLIVEAGSKFSWIDVLREGDDIVSVDQFGESCSGNVLFEHLGFEVKSIAKRALNLIGDKK